MALKGQTNDLKRAETAAMTLVRGDDGGGRREGFASPMAAHIIRCPIKGRRAPINTHELGRAIRAHLGASRPEVAMTVVAHIQNFHRPSPVTYYIPAPTQRAVKGRRKEARTTGMMPPPQSAPEDAHPEKKTEKVYEEHLDDLSAVGQCGIQKSRSEDIPLMASGGLMECEIELSSGSEIERSPEKQVQLVGAIDTQAGGGPLQSEQDLNRIFLDGAVTSLNQSGGTGDA